MYSTCLFCNASLGANEVIEHFPVGRRLAFDAAKGRLWVVCRKCERWNLSPLEERWEAIEEAERAFSGARMRVSTDNIGMAKLKEGLELVRIGSALRPEMAVWRYGDQFGRRRRKVVAYSTAAGLLVAGLVVAGPVTGYIAGGGWTSWQLVTNAWSIYQSRRVRAKLDVPGLPGESTIRRGQLSAIALVRLGDDWGLQLPGLTEKKAPAAQKEVVHILRGDDARRAAARLLPAVNEGGGSRKQVRSAVGLVADAESADALFRRFGSPASARLSLTTDETSILNVPLRDVLKVDPRKGSLMQLPADVRLALEMASHEEQERRAMEGELALLEAAWRDAEEVAKIADEMFLPDRVKNLDDFRREG